MEPTWRTMVPSTGVRTHTTQVAAAFRSVEFDGASGSVKFNAASDRDPAAGAHGARLEP